jgi:lipopolysaccharide/colanic/teichoic acid biosynthesis glycosyltransferase
MNISSENIDLNSLSLKNAYPLSKRGFDILILLIFSPFLLLVINIIAILIWVEDRNNPFFIQMRTGTYGNRFPMFKFRTMVPNADELKKELMHLNELEYPDFKIQNDPRITRVGRILRRTSLDELPQFINVALGDMSLVGPRPTSFPAETYEPWQRARLMVVPGLTGLWQVCGRSDIEFNERVELDIQYIEQQSCVLDLSILWRTVSSVLKCRGAY